MIDTDMESRNEENACVSCASMLTGQQIDSYFAVCKWKT